MAEEKSSGKLVVIIVVIVGVVMACIGIVGVLAAIAIPAFLRYIKKSKTTEAEAITRQIATQARMNWIENCAFPPALPQHTDPTACCGGEKCMPNPQAAKAYEEFGVSMADPTYFAYETEVRPNQYVVRAKADFDCQSPEQHTVELVVEGTRDANGSCSSELMPLVTTNEFE